MDGVVRSPSAFSITFTLSPSMMATQELVVPRSIPIILLIESLQDLSEFRSGVRHSGCRCLIAILALSPEFQARRAPFLISFRSEEHTSELQSRPHLVCRPRLEKKKPE